MTWRVWWLFLLTETALSISPGPAVLFVTSQGLAVGGRRALWAALGIVSGNAAWFALSAVGIGTAILASESWFQVIKWLGAAYLIYLALKPLLGRSHFQVPAPLNSKNVGSATMDVRPASTNAGIWTKAFVLQIANPKALVFFAALLPQFVVPGLDVGRQVLILGVTSVLAEFPVLALYALVAGRASRWAQDTRFARILDVLAGLLLIAAALGIAFSSTN